VSGNDIDGFTECIDDILFYSLDACADDTSSTWGLIFFVCGALGALEEGLEG
jgi:hypothetical protein